MCHGNAGVLLNLLSAGASFSTHDLMYRRRDSICPCLTVVIFVFFLGEDLVRWNGKEVLFLVAYG